MVYNQIFGVKLEYGIHNTPKQVDVIWIMILKIQTVHKKDQNIKFNPTLSGRFQIPSGGCLVKCDFLRSYLLLTWPAFKCI